MALPSLWRVCILLLPQSEKALQKNPNTGQHSATVGQGSPTNWKLRNIFPKMSFRDPLFVDFIREHNSKQSCCPCSARGVLSNSGCGLPSREVSLGITVGTYRVSDTSLNSGKLQCGPAYPDGSPRNMPTVTLS